MGLKSVILHLGAHKTGTSLIQKYMRDRRELCAAAGLAAMPRSDTDRMIGWGRTQDLGLGKAELRERIEAADRKGFDHVVISHENALGKPFDINKGSSRLYPHAPRRAAALREVLDGFPLLVVYYFRSAASFLESYYLQTIHEGGTLDFEAWRRETGRPSLSWRPLYDDLCAAFGTDRVVPKIFDLEIAKGQEGFLESFFGSFMNPDPAKFEDFAYGPVRNPSIGDKGLALALAINGMLETTPERKMMRKFLQEYFSNRTYPRPRLLADAQKEKISELFGNELVEISDNYRATIPGQAVG